MAKTKKKRSTRSATRKTTKKAPRKKSTSRRAPKVSAASKPRTKSQVFGEIAEHTDLSRKQVAEVFDLLGDMMQKDLKGKPGQFNVAGLMKVTVQHKPAQRARKGINPFTGEETMFKAKPARNVVKVRPLKPLKDMVNTGKKR